MTNMMDYLLWRGDLTLQQSPWCTVDSLIMASFSYVKLGDLPMQGAVTLRDLAPTLPLRQQEGNQYFCQWRSLFYAMAASRRFGGMVIHRYVEILDPDNATQFSAVTCDLDDGTVFVAFRGTDSTLVGWREDFNMSYESPVPSQLLATDYLNETARRTDKPIRTAGHSKGGNLAAYAAAHGDKAMQERLLSVCSFDGPGLDEATLASEGYRRILPILTSVIPESSVVGLLMGYSENYTVVRADSVSILQHDAFKWHLNGPDFAKAELNESSRILDEALHDWLRDESVENRRQFVEIMFEIAESTDAVTTADFKKDLIAKLQRMYAAGQTIDPEKKKNVQRMLTHFLSLSASSAWGSIRERVRDTVEGAGSTLRDTVEDVSVSLRDTVAARITAMQENADRDRKKNT